VKIRPATLEDLSAVLELERSVVEAPHWGEKEYRAALGGVADEGLRRCFLVAEHAAELVGFAVGKAIGSGEDVQAELESVTVAGGARRSGVGSALCEAVFTWCRRERASEVELEVRSANAAALALYEKLGFELVGKRRGYYRDPMDDAMLMRLELRERPVFGPEVGFTGGQKLRRNGG
jgi:ribosomal-protein-alanine N-acetyltransferase